MENCDIENLAKYHYVRLSTLEVSRDNHWPSYAQPKNRYISPLRHIRIQSYTVTSSDCVTFFLSEDCGVNVVSQRVREMPTGTKIAHLGLHEPDLHLTHPGGRKVVSKHASQIKQILREFNAIHLFGAQEIGYPTENWRPLKSCDGMWRNLQNQCIIASKVTV